MKTKKLPDTDPIDELARFWDEHDLTDFEDVLEQVTEPVFVREEGATIQLHLSQQQRHRFGQVGARMGIRKVTNCMKW